MGKAIKTCGNLGNVMKNCQHPFTYLEANGKTHGSKQTFQQTGYHIHVPEGAVQWTAKRQYYYHAYRM